MYGINNNFIGDSGLLTHNKVISHITIPHKPLFFFDFISELNVLWFSKEKNEYITILKTWIQNVFNKKIKVYLIVPKDVSNNDAYFTQTKKAKIIWKILVVINTDVIKRQIWNFKIVYEGTFMKK